MRRIRRMGLFLATVCLAAAGMHAGRAAAESGYDTALDAAFSSIRIVFTRKAFPKPDPTTCRITVPPEEALDFIVSEVPSKGKSGDTESAAAQSTGSSVRSAVPGQKKTEPESAEQTAEEKAEEQKAKIRLDEATVRDMLAQGELVVISYSPDGKRGVGYLGTEEHAAPVVVTEDSVSVVYPSPDRGVEDTYGKERTYYRMYWLSYNHNCPLGTGPDGMIWSPGGRYCCGMNVAAAETSRQFVLGMPVIVDTETGEMFLLDAYSNNVFTDGGYLAGGAFSEDERYFFGAFCGSMDFMPDSDSRYAVVRYDLATCEAELVTGSDCPVVSVAALPGGQLLLLYQKYGKEQDSLPDLAVVSGNDCTDRIVTAFLDQVANYRLTTFPASGTGVLQAFRHDSLRAVPGGGEGTGSLYTPRFCVDCLGILQPDRSLAENLDSVWVIFGNIWAPQAVREDASAFRSWQTAEELFMSADASLIDYYRGNVDVPWMIWETEFSPDGRYLAILASTQQANPDEKDARLLILRLSDMQLIPAYGIPLDWEKNKMYISRSQTRIMDWTAAGMIWNVDGKPTLWQLEGLD